MKNQKFHETNVRSPRHVLMKSLGTIIFVGSIGAIHVADETATISENYRAVYDNVKTVADKNRDKQTSTDEWRGVYQFLGKEYIGNEGNDLSLEELKSYLLIR